MALDITFAIRPPAKAPQALQVCSEGMYLTQRCCVSLPATSRGAFEPITQGLHPKTDQKMNLQLLNFRQSESCSKEFRLSVTRQRHLENSTE